MIAALLGPMVFGLACLIIGGGLVLGSREELPADDESSER